MIFKHQLANLYLSIGQLSVYKNILIQNILPCVSIHTSQRYVSDRR